MYITGRFRISIFDTFTEQHGRCTSMHLAFRAVGTVREQWWGGGGGGICLPLLIIFFPHSFNFLSKPVVPMIHQCLTTHTHARARAHTHTHTHTHTHYHRCSYVPPFRFVVVIRSTGCHDLPFIARSPTCTPR